MKTKPKVSIIPKGTLAESAELRRLEWREQHNRLLPDQADRLAELRRRGIKP